MLAGLAASLASAASAQQGMPPPPSAHAGGQAPSPADQSDRLRQTLHLAPSQEGALQAFIAAMQTGAGETDRIRAQSQQIATLPTPQRLDALLAQSDAMRAIFLKRMAATKAFYAHLTPEQQKQFDSLGAQNRQAAPPR
jgi:Spy/CpxP family protein refolding chaperone